MGLDMELIGRVNYTCNSKRYFAGHVVDSINIRIATWRKEYDLHETILESLESRSAKIRIVESELDLMISLCKNPENIADLKRALLWLKAPDEPNSWKYLEYIWCP